jgi:hypothetical protein
VLLSDWLDLCDGGQQECVNKMIEMVIDLQQNGVDCRYLKGFRGGLSELKSRTRIGGARVYLFRIASNSFALTRAECKKEDEASPNLVEWSETVMYLYSRGYPVLIPALKEPQQ